VSKCTSKTPGNHANGGAADCPKCGLRLSESPALSGTEAQARPAIRRTITAIATSDADNAAYLALRDLSHLTAEFEHARVIGGQMVSLLMHAYPVEGALHRRTADADAAISTQIAASGDMHARLEQAGYSAQSGNRYLMRGTGLADRTIDLLIPSSDAAFTSQVVGGRGFDAAPGLMLALAATPVIVDTNVTLTNGDVLAFPVRVPAIEHALILKAYTTQTRHESKDYTDLYNLLSIGYQHQNDPETIGGWGLGAQTTGARRDAALILHKIVDRARTVREFDEASVSRERFVALVRSLIFDPSSSR